MGTDHATTQDLAVTEHVFPRLPVRQWVLSISKRLRYLMRLDRVVRNMMLRIFLRVIT